VLIAVRDKRNFQAWQAGTWDNETTFICSLKTEQAQVLHRAGPREFTPDGNFLVVAENTSVRIVDIATDKSLVTCSPTITSVSVPTMKRSWNPSAPRTAWTSSAISRWPRDF